jgi:hypothetical protein
MEWDLHAEAARETARQVRDLQAVTAAQAMSALCFLLGAYAPRRGAGGRRDDAAVGVSDARGPGLRSQLKIVKARAVTVTGSR